MKTEKCTKQPVQNVERKQKFPLNQMEQDLFIAGIAFKNENLDDFNFLRL